MNTKCAPCHIWDRFILKKISVVYLKFEVNWMARICLFAKSGGGADLRHGAYAPFREYLQRVWGDRGLCPSFDYPRR